MSLGARLALFVSAAAALCAQSSAEIQLALKRLNVVGSALMIAAHPDDENTEVLAWLARGRYVRAGYLSLTRGEGGQNFIGSEQGDALGVIRTQELLAARRLDGAEQFFTRAIDFGYTKSAEETMRFWGRERILGDVVWTIRRFKPDVIVMRFSGTPRDGHGQHQTSAIFAKEAFAAAADPTRFPEQLKTVETWQAKRIVWNVFAFNRRQEVEAAKVPGRVPLNTGDYQPLLGRSFGEVAAASRSLHRSQAMGAAERRGARVSHIEHVAGDRATQDLFDGVDLTWKRVPGGETVGSLLADAERSFDADRPHASIPQLLKARAALRGLKGFWPAAKLAELDEAIAMCGGLWLAADAGRPSVAPGGAVTVSVTAINRSPAATELTSASIDDVPAPIPAGRLADNQPATATMTVPIPADRPYSQPFWLAPPKQGWTYGIDDPARIGPPDSAPVLTARFRIRVEGEDIELTRPVLHRYVDRAYGELTRPLEVTPPVTVGIADPVLLFRGAAPRPVTVRIRAGDAKTAGALRLEAPAGWKVAPASHAFELADAGETADFTFTVTPPGADASAWLKPVATVAGRDIASDVQPIEYVHIPPQRLLPKAGARGLRLDVQVTAKRVGYVMGAGDEMPATLRQLGCEVTLLTAADLERGDLAAYDAIVAGVRAHSTRADLRANQGRVLAYVRNGGTFVVQYNRTDGPVDRLGPYPLKLSDARVSVEDVPVKIANPGHALLTAPNRIAAEDFEGWVQERGLYFPSEWDPKYETVLEMSDPGEKPLTSGILYARYGKGVYIHTSLAWFRQLPAGVPGAYRIFANLISAK